MPCYWSKTDVTCPYWWIKVMINNSILVCVPSKLLNEGDKDPLINVTFFAASHPLPFAA